MEKQPTTRVTLTLDDLEWIIDALRSDRGALGSEPDRESGADLEDILAYREAREECDRDIARFEKIRDRLKAKAEAVV
jgi:hypothetical protein